MGWAQGMRLEVCWRITQGRKKGTLVSDSTAWHGSGFGAGKLISS